MVVIDADIATGMAYTSYLQLHIATYYTVGDPSALRHRYTFFLVVPESGKRVLTEHPRAIFADVDLD